MFLTWVARARNSRPWPAGDAKSRVPATSVHVCLRFPVEAFSTIVHREKAESYGRALAVRLKDVIPQQLFVVAIQACIGGNIIASERISAMRKNVTAKCYGGDISRKRKLLEKQKKGKEKMKAFGKVNIPQDAFIKVLRND